MAKKGTGFFKESIDKVFENSSSYVFGYKEFPKDGHVNFNLDGGATFDQWIALSEVLGTRIINFSSAYTVNIDTEYTFDDTKYIEVFCEKVRFDKGRIEKK